MTRFWGALAAYVVLGILATVLLHGTPLYAVLALFAGLAAKTLIALKAGWQLQTTDPDSETPAETGSETEHSA